ncbi:MAG: elongation factor P hydroxylase [Porticoccaceae bacterium]|nr:elongation factor P hydroxylase [Porticoccaceae bacterium]
MGSIQAVTQLSATHRSTDLEALFEQCFNGDYQTLLIGGADEPLYRPSTTPSQPHRIFYRADYFASALHEIAHWCIAGAERRLLEDWGYWYCPDGRSPEQQRAFEAVEVLPQSIEWMFSVASAMPFRISSDNLLAGNNLAEEGSDFHRALAAQVLNYRRLGLPPRAARFFLALGECYGVADPLAARHYKLATP